MFKKTITILLMCMVTLAGFSQASDLKMKYGQEFDPKGSINNFIGRIGDIIFVQSYRGGTILGGINANTLNQEFENKIEMPEYNEKKVNLKSLHIIGDQVVMFCTFYDKKADKNYLFAQMVEQNGKLDGKLIVLDEISADRKSNAGSFSVIVEDESQRILLFKNPPFEKYGKEKFAFRLYDKNLKVIWENDELELPYADRYFTLGDFFIDKNDNLYVTAAFDDFRATKEELGRKAAKAEAKERGGNFYSYKILSYTYKDKKIKEYEVELQDRKRIVSVGYNVDVNGDINIAGLYGDDDSRGSAIGIYFSKINHETRKPTSLSMKEFEKEWLKNYFDITMSEKRAEKAADKGEGIRNLIIDSFINREDGGLVIVGEIYKQYTVCYTDSKGVTRCNEHYEYNTIFVINVNPKGNIDWFATIPKLQHTVNDGGFYSSYAMITAEDGMYFIYNDNIKNYSPKNTKGRLYNMTGVKKSGTTIAKVDMSGKVTKELDLKMQKEKMLLRPKVSRLLSSDKLLVLAKLGKRERVVEVQKK